MLAGLGQVTGALAVVMGVLAVAVWALRRVPAGGRVGHGPALEVLRRVTLGPKQGIAIVRAGGRLLVVSVADAGLGLLAELPDDAASAPVATPASCAPPARPERRTRGLALGRVHVSAGFLGLGALVLALALPQATRAAAAPAAAVTGVTPATPIPAGAPGPPSPGLAVPLPPVPQIDLRVGEGPDGLHMSGVVGLVVFLGLLTLLPAMFLLMTSFTRILIVLSFLRSALGTQTTPPTQLLVALSVLLTGVVMSPVLQQVQHDAVQPFMDGHLTQVQAYQHGLQPFRGFMLANTRERDLTTFMELSRQPAVDSLDKVPTLTLVTAFVTSELRTAFQMGFVIYLPFVVIDIVVASVLMSLGMFMLPPAMISLPLKLLLFVLVDGWSLVMQNLVLSFR